MKKYLRFFYQPSVQINQLIRLSKFLSKFSILGTAASIILDNLILHLYSMEVTSRSISVKTLIIGHSTGVVLGGNGIWCSGKLHLSSGVVFARRYNKDSSKVAQDTFPMFNLNGDVTIGANSVLLGPINVTGPVIIGALSLVTQDILEPGVYVGCPAKRIGGID